MENNKCIIVCGYTKGEPIAYNISEISDLAKSCGLDIFGTYQQMLVSINVATYIGLGKAEELSKIVEDNAIDIAVFDNALSGSQIRNLEEIMKTRVIDRNILIMDIFAMRAQSMEGRLQVQLAQLKYTLPRLSGLSGSSGRFGSGGVGSRGPGETKLELDRRKIKDKIRLIEKDIAKVGETRHEQNKNRKNLKNVAIVGYTNAGKSTLLNTITKAGTYADDRLFATLDTLSKKVWDDGVNYVLTDTVGFVSRLPHELMYAFSATLEESVDSDVLLIVFDISDDRWYDKLVTVQNVLKDLSADESKYIYVANKVDIAEEVYLATARSLIGENMIEISSLANKNIDNLKSKLREKLLANNI